MLKKIDWLLVGTLLLAACRKEEIPQQSTNRINQEWQIGLNEKISLQHDAGQKTMADNISISFTNLEDSRCPANAMCIRQGAAITTFSVATSINGETQMVKLFIGDFMPNDPRNKRNLTADTVTISFGDSNQYNLILKQVTPYPGTGTEKTQATILLKQK